MLTPVALELEFAKAVKAMLEWSFHQPRQYITQADAEPFVRSLPEYWREPARIMASVGYYGGADDWLKVNAE
jgi:hypothetical protein